MPEATNTNLRRPIENQMIHNRVSNQRRVLQELCICGRSLDYEALIDNQFYCPHDNPAHWRILPPGLVEAGLLPLYPMFPEEPLEELEIFIEDNSEDTDDKSTLSVETLEDTVEEALEEEIDR